MWFKYLDLQKTSVNLNFGGTWRFKTVEGAIVSILVVMVTLSYGMVKLTDLVDGSQMNINI